MLCTRKHFKAILIALLFSFLRQEHLNIMLFELSQRFHNALSKVDISFYTSLKDEQSESKESCVPLCDHMRPAKVLVVKKEGQNKVLFISCLFAVWDVCSIDHVAWTIPAQFSVSYNYKLKWCVTVITFKIIGSSCSCPELLM